MAPIIEEVASAYAGRVKFVLLNIDQNRHTPSQYGVNGTPTFFFYKAGRLVDRVVGALPKSDLTKRLDSLVAGT